MTTDTKKLARFGAEFLMFEKYMETDEGVWFHHTIGYFDCSLTELFFEHETHSPYLAHLAKREMEKREFISWIGSYAITHHKYMWTFINKNKIKYNGLDNNEFIAFWSAIEATGEK